MSSFIKTTTNNIIPWTIDTYPIPEKEPTLCHTQTSYHFCDPDSIIVYNDYHREKIENIIQENRYIFDSNIKKKMNYRIHYDNYDDDNISINQNRIVGKNHKIVEVQYGIALMKKVRFLSYFLLPKICIYYCI